MKKMNFDKQHNEDDKLLIDLLKKVNLQEPSSEFVDNTLSKFLSQKAQTRHVHQHLKLPIVIMATLGLFLSFPMIITVVSGLSLSDPAHDFLQSLFFEWNVWYLIYPMLLLIATLLLVQLEIRRSNHQNLFP